MIEGEKVRAMYHRGVVCELSRHGKRPERKNERLNHRCK